MDNNLLIAAFSPAISYKAISQLNSLINGTIEPIKVNEEYLISCAINQSKKNFNIDDYNLCKITNKNDIGTIYSQSFLPSMIFEYNNHIYLQAERFALILSLQDIIINYIYELREMGAHEYFFSSEIPMKPIKIHKASYYKALDDVISSRQIFFNMLAQDLNKNEIIIDEITLLNSIS